MASIYGEEKFVRQQEKCSLAEKKELGELEKFNPPVFLPLLLFSLPLRYFPTPVTTFNLSINEKKKLALLEGILL